MLFVMIVIDFGRIDSHGTVQIYRQIRNFAAFPQPRDVIHHTLRTADRESRNLDYAAAGADTVDDRRQFRFRINVGVLSVAVGRLADEDVGFAQRPRCAH